MNLTPVEHLFTLQRSPIALAPVIHQFFADSEPHERNFLLSYLVLPMVLYPSMRDYLRKVKKTSNLRTLCKDHSRLIGLTHNVRQFKSLTHSAILVLQAEASIKITDKMTLMSLREVRVENANPTLLEAAGGLAKVLAGEDVASIYRTLGFKSL